MERTMEKILKGLKVEADCILSPAGDITLCYALELREVFTSSDAELESLHQSFIRAIKVLPAGSVYHQQDYYTERQFEGRFDAGQSFLSRSSERFFNERPFLQHTCFVYLTRKVSAKKITTANSGVLRRHIVPDGVLSAQTVQEFFNACGQWERIINDSGLIKATRLRSAEIASTAVSAGLIERYCLLSDERVLKDISLRGGIQVGDNRCVLYTLADVNDLPSYAGPRINYDKYSTDKTKFPVGFASVLGLLLPCNHVYNQYIFLEHPQQVIRQLEAKKLRLQSLSVYSRENAMARDAVNDFLNEAIGEQRVPVKAHVNILAFSDDETRLKEIGQQVAAAMAQMDATPKVETDGAAAIWYAGIPGMAGQFPMNDTFDTFLEQAVCFLQAETNYRSSDSGFSLRLGDRLTGMPVEVDISDEPMRRGIITNRNKFILGPSGSGKSFLTNHMNRSYHEQGTHVVIVDVGHSYKGLCDMAGGYYFTYSEKEPIRFNPFYIAAGDVLDTEKKESIKTLLLALWKKDDETFTRSEYVALSNALQLYYDKTVSFRCFDSFYEFLQNDFVAVLAQDKVKEKDFDVANFLYVLRPYYCGGEFDYLLNAATNLDLLQQRFIVFELDNIKDHPILFPVVTIIIMEVFISKMRKLKGVRKMILIEEAWKAIAKEGMAEYIKYLFKTVRKFFGEAVVVTQEVEDIISSPVVKQAIINNSDCKILLDQSKYQNKFEQVQQLLGLTEKEKALVLSMNKANDPARRYKEVFISLGGLWSKVYRTEVSPEEYLVYTTEEKEKMKVQQYAALHGSMEQGIKILANELKQ